MLTTPWQKVLVDLWQHRVRTLIVALAIAVGVYAVGVVLNAREILVREYHRDQGTALMASAIVHTAPFKEDLAESIARLPSVAAAEGRGVVTGRVYRATGVSTRYRADRRTRLLGYAGRCHRAPGGRLSAGPA